MRERLFLVFIGKTSIWPDLAAGILFLFVLLPTAWAQNDQRGLVVKEKLGVMEWPTKSKRFALIIGVDQYEDQKITSLEGAGNDARLLEETLIKNAGFPDENVILLTSDQPKEFQPKRNVILRYLTNLNGIVPKDGLLLVAFAGHGIERGGKAYLLPSDAEISDRISLLEQTAITVETVKNLIKDMEVGQIIVILDACRNDPTASRANADNPLTADYVRSFNFDVRNQEVKAFVTLYATGVGQRAYEYTDKRTKKKHGYFTQALVEGIKGGNGQSVNERGEVTLGKLIRYVQETVPRRTRLEVGREQRPFPVTEGYADEMVVALAAPPPSLLPGLKGATISLDPVAMEMSFWETIKNSDNPEIFKLYLEKYPTGPHAALAREKVQLKPSANEKAIQSSPPVSTQKESIPPATSPVAVWPENRVRTTAPVSLEWTFVPGAAEYQVEIQECLDANCSKVARDSTLNSVKGGALRFQLKQDFAPGRAGIYRWRVWVVDANGKKTTASDWNQFSLER